MHIKSLYGKGITTMLGQKVQGQGHKVTYLKCCFIFGNQILLHEFRMFLGQKLLVKVTGHW